jgi:Flp pilus assembly protein TadB
MCTPVTPAVLYLLLGLQGVQWAVGNSCGARKLARTPHVNQKKKIKKKMESIRKPRTNEQTTSVRRTWKKRKTKKLCFQSSRQWNRHRLSDGNMESIPFDWLEFTSSGQDYI